MLGLCVLGVMSTKWGANGLLQNIVFWLLNQQSLVKGFHGVFLGYCSFCSSSAEEAAASSNAVLVLMSC